MHTCIVDTTQFERVVASLDATKATLIEYLVAHPQTFQLRSALKQLESAYTALFSEVEIHPETEFDFLTRYIRDKEHHRELSES